jgi:hypothetical protein
MGRSSPARSRKKGHRDVILDVDRRIGGDKHGGSRDGALCILVITINSLLVLVQG